MARGELCGISRPTAGQRIARRNPGDESVPGRRPKRAGEQIEHCGEANEAPACKVEIRYIYQVLRAFAPEQVFAQTLLGFEYAQTDPRVVGINYVQPEDDHAAMANYALGMRQIGLSARRLPETAHHAACGRTGSGDGARRTGCDFISGMAVETGHAERIGHGVDVMYEDRPYDLLREMAANHVMVEINLTSNDVILGIAGYEHPFRMLPEIQGAGLAFDR